MNPDTQRGWSIWPAPAKLNLFLHVTGRRPDGYHEIQTLFQLLDWGDAIHILRSEDGRIGRKAADYPVAEEDDLVIRAVVEDSGEERDLRTYGSGGQQRTAAIALRLVEADTLREKLGRDPIYLLDDVFAELDRDRAERVVRLLDEGRSGQVLLTAPKPADVELRGGGLARWRIREGVVFTDG